MQNMLEIKGCQGSNFSNDTTRKGYIMMIMMNFNRLLGQPYNGQKYPNDNQNHSEDILDKENRNDVLTSL